MSSASARATCADCGKAFHVPDESRTYTCKACGGRVAVAAPAASCAECGADVGPGEAFCGACGAAQGAQDAPRGKDVALDAEERRQASHELNRALGAVRWVRVVFGLGIFGNGVTAAFLLAALAEAPESPGPMLAFFALSVLLTCVNVVGFRQARLQPFLWSVVIASLATVNLAVNLLGDDVRWQPLVLPAILVLVLWSLVPPTARVRRLIAQHPDLYAAHKLHGTQRRRHTARGAPERSREQFEEARARTARGSMLWAAGIVLVSALAAFATWSSSRGKVLAPRLVAFEEAWGRGDAAGVAALAPSDEVADRRGWLEGVAEGNGWTTGWPALGEAELERGEGYAVVYWAMGESGVIASWELSDAGWELRELQLPLPPIDAAVEHLLAAWAARDVGALAALYPPENREKAEASIGRVIERRGWGDEWPDLLEVEPEPRGEDGATLTFRVAGDELVTRWRFRGEHGWCLTSLNLPD